MSAEPELLAQPSRTGKRWGYVLRVPGWHDYVSAARWGSEEAALKAGQADLIATLRMETEEG